MSDSTLYDLTNRKSIISFTGSDCEIFLQGQTTCDVSTLNDVNSIFGALCNPKGRVISLFHLFKREHVYYMVVSKDMCESLIKRLRMFVFRSDIQISDVSEQYVALGLSQAGQKNKLISFASITYDTDSNIAMIIVSAEQYHAFHEGTNITIDSSSTVWDKQLVNECIPDVTKATSELFIPQMLNLDLLGGISFQKGCYTGQEIVARLHYKGRVKKRLIIFHATEALEAGEDIFMADNANSIGTIVCSTPDSNNNFIGLVVIKTSVIESKEIVLQNGQQLTLQPPKYHLD